MKITTYLTDCKRKVAEQSSLLNNIGSEENAYLCFRLRDKNLDLKVRTDILVMSELWDNDIPGYGKTRKLSSADKKKVNTLATDIITKLSDEYDAETADAV